MFLMHLTRNEPGAFSLKKVWTTEARSVRSGPILRVCRSRIGTARSITALRQPTVAFPTRASSSNCQLTNITMNCVLYARVSTDKQADLSIPAQLDAMRAYAHQ